MIIIQNDKRLPVCVSNAERNTWINYAATCPEDTVIAIIIRDSVIILIMDDNYTATFSREESPFWQVCYDLVHYGFEREDLS